MAQTVSVDTAAAMLGVGRSSLYQWLRQGETPLKAIRLGRRVVLVRADVERLLGTQTSEKLKEK